MRYGLHPDAQHHPDSRGMLMDQIFRTTGVLTILILVLVALFLVVRFLVP